MFVKRNMIWKQKNKYRRLMSHTVVRNMLKGFAVLLIFQFLGELLQRLLDWPIPGPIVGMVLLVLSLQLGLIRLNHVEPASTLLLDNLGLLFVPVGVGLTASRAVLRANLVPIGAAIAVSTLLTLLVTGKTVQFIEARYHDRKEMPE